MAEMTEFNHRSAMGYLFVFMDCLLVVAALVLAGMIHPGGRDALIAAELYSVAKIMFVVLIVAMTFYYLDLLELRLMRERIRMSIQLIEALGIYTIILVVMYHVFPDLSLNHGVLAVSLGLIFLTTWSWRLLYPWLTSKALFRERVLIVGTGALARKVQKDIEEYGQDAYEIVGFVDENGKRVGEKIGPDDYRGLQADLFHQQNLSN